MKPAGPYPVLSNLTPSSVFGWGIVGLNLMLHWARSSPLALHPAAPVDLSELVVDPIDAAALLPLLLAGEQIRQDLKGLAGRRVELPCPVVNGLSPDFRTRLDPELAGSPTVGLVMFERAGFSEDALDRARQHDLLIAASRWNQDLLKAAGIERVELAIQGVDTTAFHPAPRRGVWSDRFVVFSGGKLERRKGQDLVIRAFRRFARHHPDALLLTAWASPFTDFAREFDDMAWIEPVPFRDDRSIDQLAWTRANGIPDDQVCHLPMLANILMPRVLREADLALFPNRAEGGTNLVAMECLASGIPTILAANTGQRDIIREDTCYILERQSPIDEPNLDGWGESDPDEIVEAMERAYADRSDAKTRGLQSARFMAGYTWARYADELAAYLTPYLPATPRAVIF
jgi:glycosyltransferase involved in cell wall biosynthesis